MRALLPAAALLVGYVGVVVWETWPLAAHAGTHLAATSLVCRTDVPYITWVLAWQSHALLTAPGTLLDANIYWPARRTLFYGDPGLGALPLFAPVFLATANPTLAINWTFIGGIALTAWSLHLVVHRWTGSHLAGVAAAATLLTNPWAIWNFFPWAPSYTVLCYLPWIVYLAARPATRLRDAAALVPLLVLQCLGNMVYVTAATLAPLGMLATVRLLRPATRAAGLRLAMALAATTVLLAPVYAGYLGTRQVSDDIRGQSLWRQSSDRTPVGAESLVVDIGGVPRVVLAVPSALLSRSRPTWAAAATLAAIGAGLLLGRLRAHRSAWAHGALWVVAGFLLSIPACSVFGGRPLPMPHYELLARLLPVANEVIREPYRLGIASIPGWGILAGVAFAACAARLGRWLAAALLLVVVGGMYAQFRPYVRPEFPLAEAIDGSSAVTQALRAAEGPVLELPVGGAGTQAWPHARAMYRSIFHWRPLLNGYSSYWPNAFPARMQLALRLPDADALAALRRETGLAWVVVGLRWLLPQQRALWEHVAAGGRRDLTLAVRDEDELLFAVGPPASD